MNDGLVELLLRRCYGCSGLDIRCYTELFPVCTDHLMILAHISLQIAEDLIGILSCAVVDRVGVGLRFGRDLLGACERLFIDLGLAHAILKIDLCLVIQVLRACLRLTHNLIGFLLRLLDHVLCVFPRVANGIVRFRKDAGRSADIFGDRDLQIAEQIKQAIDLHDTLIGRARKLRARALFKLLLDAGNDAIDLHGLCAAHRLINLSLIILILHSGTSP